MRYSRSAHQVFFVVDGRVVGLREPGGGGFEKWENREKSKFNDWKVT